MAYSTIAFLILAIAGMMLGWRMGKNSVQQAVSDPAAREALAWIADASLKAGQAHADPDNLKLALAGIRVIALRALGRSIMGEDEDDAA